MFRLERPSMAVNDPRRCTNDGNKLRFQMWNTWDIQPGETRGHIVEWVAHVADSAPGGKLKHLVLNCHGAPGYLQLGQGFCIHQLPLLEPWKTKIEKIWLIACEVARIPEGASGGSDGNLFCSELAKRVKCYVVASTETQCDITTTQPIDMVTSLEGLVLSYGPAGNITWRSRNPSSWTNGAGVCVPVPD